MKAVAETLHLQKRGGVWHYYRRTPLHLVPIIKKRFFKRSLKTSSLAEAKKLRTVEDLKVDALFAAAEQHTFDDGDTSKPVSLHALIEYVRQTVERLDTRSAESLATDPPQDLDELNDRWKEADYERSILANPADPRRDEWISHAADRILSDAGATPSGVDAQFAEIVRRGLIELTRRKIDRLEERHDRPFHDSLFDPARPSLVTFRELAKIYLAEKQKYYSLNNISKKRTDKVTAIVETLREIVGDQTPVHSIDDDVVQHVRNTLARTPSNRIKLYPKLKIEQAIEQAAKYEKPTLSPTTQSFYLDAFRDVLQVGVRKKQLANNPAVDAKPIKKDTLSAEQKRLPWTLDQIKGFFEGAFYRSCAPDAVKPYKKPDRAWRFWLPLIMLHSGARPNEICQLHVADVKRTPAGVWYLDMIETDDGEDSKSLKTETSRRRVPLHPELARMGFLAFVEERRKAVAKDGERLFPKLKPNRYGNVAWYPCRRLNEHFIPREISLGERQCLYSLRHSVRDALRRIKAPPETLLAVGGWAQGSKTVSDDYGDPGDPDLHAEYVAKIAYPGLNLSYLRLPEHAPSSEVVQCEAAASENEATALKCSKPEAET